MKRSENYPKNHLKAPNFAILIQADLDDQNEAMNLYEKKTIMEYRSKQLYYLYLQQ